MLSYYNPSMREPTVLEPLPQQPTTPTPSTTAPLGTTLGVPSIGSIAPPNGSTFPTRRWVHITLVHHMARAPNNVRVFLDGTLYATATSPYPKTSPPPVSLFVGNDEPRPDAPPVPPPSSSPLLGNRLSFFGGGSRPRTPVLESQPDLPPPNPPSMPSGSRFHNALSNKLSDPIWFLASSHLLLQSLPNELPRLCFTLGPSYVGNFQDCLSKFLTYKTSTSLNIGLQNQKHHNSQEGLGSLTKALNEGIDLKESHIAYSLNPYAISEDETRRGVLVVSRRESNGKGAEFGEVVGSTAVIRLTSLHAAVWDFGGAAVLLRLVELASVGIYGSYRHAQQAINSLHIS